MTADETVFTGRLIKLVLRDVVLQDGSRKRREIIVHPGAAAVLAVRNGGMGAEVLLVEQFRKAVERTTLEIPAGTLEENETPEECARRELLEETGYDAMRFEKLISFFPSPGYSNEVIHIFKATELRSVGDAELKPIFMPVEKVLAKIRSGEIKDGKTIIGILFLTQCIDALAGK